MSREAGRLSHWSLCCCRWCMQWQLWQKPSTLACSYGWSVGATKLSRQKTNDSISSECLTSQDLKSSRLQPHWCSLFGGVVTQTWVKYFSKSVQLTNLTVYFFSFMVLTLEFHKFLLSFAQSLIDPSPHLWNQLPTPNSSSKLFISHSATFIWTCWFNLLHTAIHHFHHFPENLVLHL